MTIEEYSKKHKELFLEIEKINRAVIRENTIDEFLGKKVVVTYKGENGVEEHEAYYHGFTLRLKDKKVVYDFNKVCKNGTEANIRNPKIENIDNVIKIELA